MRTLICLAALTALAVAQDPKQEKIYDEKADAAKVIDAALAQSKKENRRVLIQWGANGRGWCKKLHAAFKKGQVRRKLQYEYDVVLVDVGKFDKNMDLAKKYGAELKANGIPYLTVLAPDGKVLANQDTGSLEDGAKHDTKKVMDFLTKHQAKYLKASEVLADALARAKTAKKRAVLIDFGAPW